jgi:hypothetical protein
MSCRAKRSPVTYKASATSNLNPEPGARYASATSRASITKNATPQRPRICGRFFSCGDTLQDINGIGVDALWMDGLRRSGRFEHPATEVFVMIMCQRIG